MERQVCGVFSRYEEVLSSRWCLLIPSLTTSSPERNVCNRRSHDRPTVETDVLPSTRDVASTKQNTHQQPIDE